MEAEVRSIEANDIPDWPQWSATDPSCELQWFTLTIGPQGDSGGDLFQVVVATPLGIRQRRAKGKFIGLVVDRFEPQVVEQAIRAFVAQSKAHTWQDIAQLLRTTMRWEYEDYRNA